MTPLTGEENHRPTETKRRFFLVLEVVTIILVLSLCVGGVRRQVRLDSKLMAALKDCRRGQDLGTVRNLLQQGASPNAANTGSDSLTALMVAASRGYPSVVKLLLDSGADVNAKGKIMLVQRVGNDFVLEGVTSLLMAAFDGDAQICRMLLDHGANIHALDSRGSSVMLYARSNDVVQLFLDRGLDINAHDKDGNTLLIVVAMAYASGNPHSLAAAAVAGPGMPDVDFLLQRGADPNAKNRDGLTPLMAAAAVPVATGRSHLIALLKEAGAKQ